MLKSLRFLLGGLGDGAGIPNGCPIAAICGNAVLDHHVLRCVEIPTDTTLTIFIDDMVVVGRSVGSVARATREIRAALRHVSLEPHPKKSDAAPRSGPLEFLGLLIDEEKISVPAKVVSRLRCLVPTMSTCRQFGLLSHYRHCLTFLEFQEILKRFPWNMDLTESMNQDVGKVGSVNIVGGVDRSRISSAPLSSVHYSSFGCHQDARCVPKRDESARHVGNPDVPHPRKGCTGVPSGASIDPGPEFPFSTTISSDQNFTDAASVLLRLIRERHQPPPARPEEIHPVALVSARHEGHVDRDSVSGGLWLRSTSRSNKARPALAFTDLELDFDPVISGACPNARALGLESPEFLTLQPEDALTEPELEVRAALSKFEQAAIFLAREPYLFQRQLLRDLKHEYGIERSSDVPALTSRQVRRALDHARMPELHSSHDSVCDGFLIDAPTDRWSPKTITALPCQFYPCIPGGDSEEWRGFLRNIEAGFHEVVALDLSVPDGRLIRETRYSRRDVLREAQSAIMARRRKGHPDPHLYILTDQVRYPSEGNSWNDGPSDAPYLKSLGGEFLYRSNDKWGWWPESTVTAASGTLASLVDTPTLIDEPPVPLAQA